MKYLALIYSAANSGPQYGTPGFNEFIGEYETATAKYKDAKVFVAGEGLQPTSTATTVRVRNGKTETMDGPFAETKESLGGFYLLDCDNLDQAIKYAAMIPTAKFGCVEVRPVMNYDN